MRIVALALVASLALGCQPTAFVPPSCPDAGVAPRACDAPAVIDPAAVVDLATFRAEASRAICDLSLRCGIGLFGDSYCHPGFAALEAARYGPPALAFDLTTARTCVTQLTRLRSCNAAWGVANDCHGLSASGVFDEPPSGPGLGEACMISSTTPAAPCGYGLVCDATSTCALGADLGDACDAAHPCAVDLACDAGTCSVATRTGQGCASIACGEGLTCHGTLSGWFFPTEGPPWICTCASPDDAPEHHVGCACASDADCPADVAVCSEGTCTLRPFAGEPCVVGGPACFGARCDAGTCRLLHSGEGACAWDADCDTGLVCGTECGGSRVCGALLQLGDACGPTIGGRCASGTCDGGVCTDGVARGGRCVSNLWCACAAGLTCQPTGYCF